MGNIRLLLLTTATVIGFASVVSAAAGYDVNGDGKEGLAEAIHALQVAAGEDPPPPPGTYTNTIGMSFRLLPAGSFIMGSPDGTGDTSHPPVWPSELGRDSGEKQHIVKLSKSFYMQTTEVTQGQWVEVMGTNPSYFDDCGLNCPVEMVSWNDAKSFITTLNTMENRTGCDETPNACYALPTESQWEYAARAGTVTAFYNSDITNTGCSPLDANLDRIAWYCGNAENTTHPVGEKEPNGWGLYDMIGNLMEWCEDFYGTYPDGNVTDPTGAASSSYRVVRGGSWVNSPVGVRAADRSRGTPAFAYDVLGFRLVLPSGQ